MRMRLGETYLLAAEAAGCMGDFAKAVDYINVIRKRAAWAAGERKNRQIYEIEGGRELLGELNRWEDLARCEVLYDWVKKHNPDAVNIRSDHKLRPIPQKHIDRLNPVGALSEEQNEGYY